MLILKSDNLDLPRITHGFFGRGGGLSTGIYSSLNCGPGSSDTREHVAENRRRVREALGAAELNTLFQVHSATAVTVNAAWHTPPQADAMVTTTPGIALGILSADCAPVLFADGKSRVIGAAHAGWKGALSGIIEATVGAMESLGARRDRICAAVGPCISQANYEVGDDFRVRFLAADSTNGRFFAPGNRLGHCQFGLAAFVSHRLQEAGITAVERVGGCTYADETRFFSFRRATHRGEKDYGREISVIVLT